MNPVALPQHLQVMRDWDGSSPAAHWPLAWVSVYQAAIPVPLGLDPVVGERKGFMHESRVNRAGGVTMSGLGPASRRNFLVGAGVARDEMMILSRSLRGQHHWR